MNARYASVLSAIVGLGLAALACSGCITVKTTSPSKPVPPEKKDSTSAVKVGETVAARWTDGNMYLASVMAADGNVVTVKYVDDGSVRNVGQAEVRPIPSTQWTKGDRVLAVWSLGRFYPGTITKAGATRCTVKWDDGSAPTEVDVGKIIAE